MARKPKHAKLAPSASERWINCPISVHLSEGFPDSQSEYAAEGTHAHKLGELKLRNEFSDKKPAKATLTRCRKNKLYSVEMEEMTDEYVERIREVYDGLDMADLSTEIRLDMTDIVGGDCFGTADCIVVAPGILHVFDFKYGRNVEVSAVENPQMRLYALGAFNLFDDIYGIDEISTHIIQPRMNNFSSETLTVDELQQWADATMKPAAHDAVVCGGQPHSGKWCQFCLAKPVCREYGKPFENVPSRELPPEISNAEVAERIAMLEGVDAYLKALKEYALKAVLSGNEIPGYKAVEGRSNRVWTDQESALKKAESLGYDHSKLYSEVPITLSQLERLMGEKKFTAELGAFVDKPKGKPTLVKNSDTRESFKRTTAKEDFKNIEMEFD